MNLTVQGRPWLEQQELTMAPELAEKEADTDGNSVNMKKWKAEKRAPAVSSL